MDPKEADYIEWAHACARLTRVEDEKELMDLYEFIYLVNTHWTHYRPGRTFGHVGYYFNTHPASSRPLSFKIHGILQIPDYSLATLARGYRGLDIVTPLDKTLLEHLLLALQDLAEYSKQKFLGVKHV